MTTPDDPELAKIVEDEERQRRLDVMRWTWRRWQIYTIVRGGRVWWIASMHGQPTTAMRRLGIRQYCCRMSDARLATALDQQEHLIRDRLPQIVRIA
ncbi:hypothetical protein ACBJ59_61425 [Nonomuraea sp. MTCD27]|uniref:hypothetical protein n=1 Tax=Nonomuraea sp. MTCD27 TaxID=1676747 RepID=UPI0035BF9515